MGLEVLAEGVEDSLLATVDGVGEGSQDKLHLIPQPGVLALGGTLATAPVLVQEVRLVVLVLLDPVDQVDGSHHVGHPGVAGQELLLAADRETAAGLGAHGDLPG